MLQVQQKKKFLGEKFRKNLETSTHSHMLFKQRRLVAEAPKTVLFCKMLIKLYSMYSNNLSRFEICVANLKAPCEWCESG